MKICSCIFSLCSFFLADIINVPEDYTSIQAGINSSMDGDTVLVAPGYYQENLVIDRSIVLASHAIYDNLDEWVVFDDFMFFQWKIANENILNT